jgi:hypothetical protein
MINIRAQRKDHAPGMAGRKSLLSILYAEVVEKLHRAKLIA